MYLRRLIFPRQSRFLLGMAQMFGAVVSLMLLVEHCEMGRDRAIPLGVLTIALGVCQSCGQNPSVGYLTSPDKQLVNRTVPAGASKVTQQGVKRTEWSNTGSWQFDTKSETRNLRNGYQTNSKASSAP